MKRYIISILVVCVSLTAKGQTDTLSFLGYRSMVVDYSNQLKMSRAATSAAQSKVKAVKTGYFPALSVSADANYLTNSPASTSAPGMDVALKNFSYNGNLTLQQNVYTGNAVTNQTKAAKIELDIAQMGEDLAMENVVYAADVTYWALAASVQQLDVMNRYVSIVTSLYDVVKTRFTDGYVAKTDLLMVETRLNEAKLQQIAARRLYEQSLHGLNTMIGRYNDVDYKLLDSITAINLMPATQSLDYALENRADYRRSLRDIDLQNQMLRLSRSKFNPQLVVGLQGISGTSTPNFSGAISMYGVAFASLRAPIFHWGERQNTVAQARAGVMAKEYASIDVRDNVAKDLQNALTNLRQNYVQTQVADSNLRIAQENLELNTYSYGEGRLPILDVLSAQLSWIQSYTAAVNSNYQYKVAVAEYRKALGISY